MSPELTALALATLLQIAQIALFAVLGNRELGVKYALSTRDQGRVLCGYAARAQRAMNNHFESLSLFAIAAILCHLSQASSHITALAGWAYLGSRILYVPAYIFALTPWRTIFWVIGLGAICTLLGAALL